jgi:transposase
MIYVGMDISSKDFMIYAVDERKKVKFKGSINPTKAALRQLIDELGLAKKLFVFEAGNQMKWIADFFKKENQDIHVVHPNEVKWITQSSGKKTDKVDARKLAELGRADMLPRRVHVAEGKARDLRELVGARQTVLSKRVSLMNTIRGYLKQEGVRLPAKFFVSNEWQVHLIGLKLRAATESIVANLMYAVEQLQECEKGLNSEIQKVEDKKIELIETILYAAIIDETRFDNSKCIANYGGLTPTIHQSGDTLQLGKINRNGRSEIRRALLQCAHAVARTKTAGVKPLKEFFERIEKRRGKKRALVALARKLLTTVYGVLKSGEVYNPTKLKAA